MNQRGIRQGRRVVCMLHPVVQEDGRQHIERGSHQRHTGTADGDQAQRDQILISYHKLRTVYVSFEHA